MIDRNEKMFVSETERQRVLVTGGGQNIGARIAESFAAANFDVFIVGRRLEPLQRTLEAIKRRGGRCWLAQCDVTNPEATQQLRRDLKVGGEFRVDILVNCAMHRVQKPLPEMSFDEWKQVNAVVLDGAFNMTRLCLPEMYLRRWGRVINFSGLAGQAGATNRAGIVTAKAGIIGFTKAVALESAPYGVTANAVSPGIIDTDRGEGVAKQGALAADHYAKERDLIPLGRMGRVEEVVAAVRCLASEGASFVTGQVININGGRYMG